VYEIDFEIDSYLIIICKNNTIAFLEDLLLNVLLGRPIFNKASLEITEMGFRQELKTPYYNIVYKREGKDISFNDKHNKIKIKISKIY